MGLSESVRRIGVEPRNGFEDHKERIGPRAFRASHTHALAFAGVVANSEKRHNDWLVAGRDFVGEVRSNKTLTDKRRTPKTNENR